MSKIIIMLLLVIVVYLEYIVINIISIMCYMFITILHKLHFNILPVEISWTKLNCLVYRETEKKENWQKERMKEKDSSKRTQTDSLWCGTTNVSMRYCIQRAILYKHS